MTIPSNVRTLIGPWHDSSGAPAAALPSKSPTLHGFGAVAPMNVSPVPQVQPRLPSKHATLVGLNATPNVYVESMALQGSYSAAIDDPASVVTVPTTRVSPLAIMAAVFAGFVFLGALIATVLGNLVLG